MSWTVTLEKKGKVVKVPKHTEGAIIALGGSDMADLTVTYNYARYYYEHIHLDQGIRFLHGKTAKEMIPILVEAVQKLGTDRDKNYWKKTSGNAGYALSILLGWAKKHPSATFRVS